MRKLLKALTAAVFLLAPLHEAQAVACTSIIATGNWDAQTTWGKAGVGCSGAPGGIPGSADTATIADGDTVTLNITTTIAGLTITGTGATTTLVHSGTNALTVNGTVTINQPTSKNISSLWNIAAGSATVSGLTTLAGTNTTASQDSNLTLSTGTLNANGGITCAGTTPATKNITISSTGTINMKGALSNAGGTFAPGTAGIFNYNDSVAQTVALTWGAGNYYHLHLNNTSASGVTLPAAITATNVGGNLRVQSGLSNNGGFAITGGANDTFSVADGATFNMSGTAVFPTGFSTYTFSPASTVRYRQSNAQTVSTQTYGHLEVSPSANGITHAFAAGTTTVAGNLTAGNGTNTGVIVTAATNATTLDVNGSITISANTTLTAHATNPFTVAGNWTNNGTFTANGGTVTFDGASAQSITGATIFSNLVIANAAGVTANNNLTMNGNFTINASAVFNAGGVIHNLNGNFTNNGTFDANTSTVLFTGGALQTLAGTTTFRDLTFNNAAGFTLNNDITASNALTLTSGVIATGANTLIFSSTSSCSATRTSGRVNGKLRKNFTSSLLSCTFEIGDATNYTPVAVTFTSLTAAGYLTASTTTPDHPQIASSAISPAKSVNRYWTLNSTITGIYDATFTFVVGDVDAGAATSNFIVQRYTSSAWFNTTYAAADPTSTSASGINDFGDFAIGEPVISSFLLERELIYIREVYD